MNLKTPFLAVDAIIQVFEEDKFRGIVLIQRKNPPYGWALPGGFVDYGESLEEAVVREIKEETGLDLLDIRQFHAYSSPQRDPRRHVVSVVFIGNAFGLPVASDDAKDAKVYKLEELPWGELAFDHREILRDYVEHRY